MLPLREILGHKLKAGRFMVQVPGFSWKAGGCQCDGRKRPGPPGIQQTPAFLSSTPAALPHSLPDGASEGH